ncbi:MAG: hypothetical protein QM658_17700, partial [Gordonia sp. (in: high G+C Gram-positive bacteria)]
ARAAVCPSSATTTMSRTATAQALRDTCTQVQFDHLFRTAHAGPMPLGAMHGHVRPVGPPNDAASAAASSIWIGKTFHRGWLTNRAFGGEILPADVFYAPSTVDGKTVIRIDYRRSGVPVGHDELRRLSNGLYLGYGFLNDGKAVDFWVWK